MGTIKAPQTYIQAYLYNNHNIEIYEDLTEAGDYYGLFEPLEFFNLLYSEFEYFKINENKYLDIKRHFSNINLEGEQRYYFFWALHKLLDDDFSNDDAYKNVAFRSYEYVLKLYREISNQLYPSEEKETVHLEVKEYDFKQVKEHIDTLPETKDKIKYLIEVKTEFQQNKEFDFDWGTSFDEQCELEIHKLNSLSQLEGNPVSKPDKEQLFERFTNSQLVLIFYYFFKYCGFKPRINVEITPIAKFLHLLTGKDFTNSSNSDFYKKLAKAPNFKKDKELIKDLEEIKPLFEKVHLQEIVKMIDNEIETSRNELMNNKL